MSGWDQAAVDNVYRRLREPTRESSGKPHGLECICVECEARRKPAPKPTGRTPWSPKMNANERAYASHLLARKLDGEVLWFAFQPVTILLGPDCRFTPDFLVLYADGRLELHDTKGSRKVKTGKKAGEKTYYAEEDATIKARVTAAAFPIPVYFLFSTGDGGWGKREFGG